MSQLHLYVLRHAIYNEPLANSSEMLKIYYNVVKHVRQIFLVRVSNGCPLFTYYISFSNVVSQGFRTAITSQIYILFHTSILCVHSIELFEIKENTGDHNIILYTQNNNYEICGRCKIFLLGLKNELRNDRLFFSSYYV